MYLILSQQLPDSVIRGFVFYLQGILYGV